MPESLYLMIEVGENGKFRFDMKGNTKLKMLLLGGIDVAKAIVRDELLDGIDIETTHQSKKNETLQQEKIPHNDGAQVPKKKAVDFYLELRNTIDKRLKSIVQSDDRMTFIIPNSIDL